MIAEPHASPEDDDLAGYDVNGRMCIVTRESGSPDELIRFVAAPDGTVIADLKRQLPGRGCWVKLDRTLVDKAVAKKSLRPRPESGREGSGRSRRNRRPAARAAVDADDEHGAQSGPVRQRLLESGRRSPERSGAGRVPFDGCCGRRCEKNRPGSQGLAPRNGNRGGNTFLPSLLGERNGRR